jgi:hypothetical protein
MSLADEVAEEQPRRLADGLLAGASHIALSQHHLDPPAIEAEAAADRVIQHWHGATGSLIRACSYLVSGLDAFAGDAAKLDVFLRRLVTSRVLSENDALARLKANGKLAMLTKIGRNADALLLPSVICFLPAYYSIIYQVCLLIEEVGRERAEAELAEHHDLTRDDVVKIRAALMTPNPPSDTAAPILDNSAAQLFAVRLTAQDVRTFANDYPDIDILDQCLHRPQPADDAGLVALVPIRALGTFERELMPLLGFDGSDHLYLGTALNQPEITDHDVIVVAKRGGFRPQTLTAFPPDAGSVRKMAEFFFPGCNVKCQLFADARADGWSTLIGDENWNEMPSVR